MLYLTVPSFSDEEWVEPEIITSSTWTWIPEQEDGSDDEDVQVDFSAKETLEYKLQTQLFAPAR